MWTYRARIIDVHDGDTVTAVLDLGFTITATVRVRLADVYAPELNQPGGPEARDYLRAIVVVADATHPDTWPFLVKTTRQKNDAREVTTFGRYVAEITNRTNNDDVNETLALHYAENNYPMGAGG